MSKLSLYSDVKRYLHFKMINHFFYDKVVEQAVFGFLRQVN